jgi:hypothetical protein
LGASRQRNAGKAEQSRFDRWRGPIHLEG